MIMDFDKVDMMFIKDNKPNCLFLVISDHLDWTNRKEHLTILQEKLNKYVTFILNNGYKQEMPESVFKRFTIIICLKFEPEKIFKRFIKDYQNQLHKDKLPVELEYEIVRNDGAENPAQ